MEKCPVGRVLRTFQRRVREEGKLLEKEKSVHKVFSDFKPGEDDGDFTGR